MKIGQRLLDRYAIEELIGEGSTAVVYKAQDLRLHRTVAIKALLSYVPEQVAARFKREAQSAAALNHPNIMAIYDQAEEDDQQFLVVEYIEGKPLETFMPSEPQIVADLGTQLCQALDYAHRLNFIHRDVKPANIKVTHNGVAKLMDFGLAMMRDTRHITSHGSVVGTPAYLSPEQARGHKLDQRTDIYSLGIILYEMATGRLPFDAPDVNVLLLQKVSYDPLQPSDMSPGIPMWLDRAIMKAIQRDPDLRYWSAAEFAAALSREMPIDSTSRLDPVLLEPIPVSIAEIRETEDALPVTPSKPAIKVIVADDHEILRTSVMYFLSEQPGISVLAGAATGEEVMALVRDDPPDVLLLDLNMPGRSGLQILPILRTSYPDIRVLVMTGRSEEAYLMRALQAGAHGFLYKTSSQEELLESIRKVYDGHMILGTGVAEKVVSGLFNKEKKDPLNADERTILMSIAAGSETNKAIEQATHFTEQRIIDTIQSVIDKLGAENRAQAALMALRAGWITLDDARQDFPEH